MHCHSPSLIIAKQILHRIQVLHTRESPEYANEVVESFGRVRHWVVGKLPSSGFSPFFTAPDINFANYG